MLNVFFPIDKLDIIDENDVMVKLGSIVGEENKNIPIKKGYGGKIIGYGDIKIQGKTMYMNCRFGDDFSIHDLHKKNLAPMYSVEKSDCEKNDDGVIIIKKGKITEVAVIKNIHSSGIEKINLKEDK